jgi:hypothetical protein
MTASATDARDAAPPARPARLLSGVDTVCELLVARRALDERDGLDTRRSSSIGTGSVPRASSLASSPSLASRPTASAAVVGAWYSKAVGFNGVLSK